ncbi:MAG: (d)CMP kinase [Proteobacteria bacterium]|nr:(d)CMP kinase [Pseudomonadota bacterium]
MPEGRNRAFVIAVDGPAASGKGTLARRLAAHLGYAYLDTGLIYRAVGLALMRKNMVRADPGAALQAARALSLDDLDDPELRGDDVAGMASQVAALPEVRAALIDYQRRFAQHPPGKAKGVILDGRDIGTVICPDADAKIFVEASVDTRANRRVKELRDRGLEAIYARVLEDMKERDARDRSRSVAPMVPADDAHSLDTTNLDAEAAFQEALEFITSQNMSDA